METSEEVRQLNGIKVYIIESLRPGDKRTGEDLKDTLRQMCIDKGFSFLGIWLSPLHIMSS